MSPAWRSRLQRLAWVTLLIVTFLVASVAGLVLHLGMTPGRRVVAQGFERLLAGEFRGSFEIDAIDALTPGLLLAREVRVRDPDGKLVLRVEGLRVRTDIPAIVREVVFGTGKVTVVIEHVRAERVHVFLIPNRVSGEPTLAAAFELRPGAPKPPGAPPARPVRVWLPAIEIGRGFARGNVIGLPPIDADVFGARGSVLVSPVGVAVDAPRFAAVVRGMIAKELRAVGSFHQRGTSRFWSSLDGYAGELQFDSVVRLDGKHLKATVDVPRAEPAAVRALVPDWPLYESVGARIVAEGDLPLLNAEVTASVGLAQLGARGEVNLGRDFRANFDAWGKDIDLRAVFPEVPETKIAAKAKLSIGSDQKGVTVDVSGSTEPTAIERFPVPGSEFSGRFAEQRLTGTGSLHEPGMPLAVRFDVKPGGVIDLEVNAPRFRLERVPRLAALGASGSVQFQGKAHLAEQRVAATLVADVESLVAGPLRAGRAKVTGRANGPISRVGALELDARANLTRFSIESFALDEAELTAAGTLGALRLGASMRGPNGLSISGKTRLSAVAGTRFEGVDLVVARGAASVHAEAARIDLRDGSVEVNTAQVTGLGGSLTGSGRYRPGLLELAVHGDELDLGTIAQLLGRPPQQLAGKLRINADVALARDVRRGHVDIALREAVLGPLPDVTLEINSTLEGDQIDGESMFTVGGFGRVRSVLNASVSGSLLERASYVNATGRWDFGVERVDLGRLLAYLPKSLQLSELQGQAIAQITLLRTEPGAAPVVTWLASTEGLAFVRDDADVGEAPLEVSGIEAQLGGSWNGKDGLLDATLRLIDARGLLVASSARVQTDPERVLAAPGAFFESLPEREISVNALVEGRAIEELPELIRPAHVRGLLRAEVNLRGTLKQPIVSVKTSVAGLSFSQVGDVRPIDVCARGQYDPSAERVGLGLEVHLPGTPRMACSGKRVAVANASGVLDLAALGRGQRGFAGDAQAALEGLPLEIVGPLADAGMSGHLDGRIALVQTGELPELSARLTLREGTIRGVPLGGGNFDVRSDGRDLIARIRLSRGDGALDAEGRAGVDWSGIAPALDRSRALSVAASFQNIDAGVLNPVIGDILAELSGRLDGSARISLVPRDPARPAAGFSGDVTGKLSLQNGSFQIAGLGMRLNQVKFDAEAKKIGKRTVVAIRNLSAASRSRHPNVAASGDLYLDGIVLSDGRANVNLRQVPLMIEGISQATLTGSAKLALERKDQRMLVTIQLPQLNAELPRSAGHNAISVDENPDIVILQPIAEPTLGGDGNPLEWVLTFELGPKVRVVRADLEVPLRGRPVIRLGNEVSVTGDLELDPGGRVQLIGKAFVIENGEIHFDTGDASNPHLRVLASWHAPDGTVVYVEVRGTVREATLRLESDPALPQAEIQALLLGGGSSEGGGDAQAAGIGYGADFLSEFLADTPLRNVELRTGSETTADDRSYSTYTAAIPISENIWFEGSYKNLETADASERGSAFSGTIDWRFRRNWSLRTEIGTIGTGLDLLWQYRY
jgi:hypothetical protein